MEPIAWARRWYVDGIDVMALPKAERPHGWSLMPTSSTRLLEDDVPLHASAPELVEALKAMDDYWTADLPEGPDGSRTVLVGGRGLDVWRKIRAALSKAGVS